MLTITKYEELNKFATELQENGFTILSAYNPDTSDYYNSYFKFYKDGYFGYVQYDRMEGFTMSTVNKPCQKYGTGHRFTQGHDILTVKNANECLQFSARLIGSKKEIVNYKSIAEFLKAPMNSNFKLV
jgi:hypothetical protein